MKLSTVQDVLWSIPGLISCTDVTGRWGTAILCNQVGYLMLTNSAYHCSFRPLENKAEKND